MRNITIGAPSSKSGLLVFVSAFAFLAPSLTFGGSSSCPTTSGTELTLGTIDTLSPGNGLTGGLSTGGCSATDQTFGNFGVSGFSTPTTPPSLTNTDAYTTPDLTSDAQDLTTNLKESLPAASMWSGSSSTTGNVTLLSQFGSAGGPLTTDTTVNEVAVTVSGINLDKAQGANDASIQVTVYVCENP